MNTALERTTLGCKGTNCGEDTSTFATADSDETTTDGVSQNGVAKLSERSWESDIFNAKASPITDSASANAAGMVVSLYDAESSTMASELRARAEARLLITSSRLRMKQC